MDVQKKFEITRRELGACLIERESEIDLALVAMLAGEHVLLVGPPGTGKSMLANAIVQWMDCSKFEILLTKFTTPEEVFGPISLAGLKSDRYRRITTGKMPVATVAFVDEIFKASSAILNTMLTILNERRFDNDGERSDCPLALCISASNEWPGDGDNGHELGALFDRFVLRRHVAPIKTASGLNRLLWDDLEAELSTKLTTEELRQAWFEVAAVSIPEDVAEAFLEIHREAKEQGIFPGDRRLRKAVKCVKAYAYLNGHREATKDDLDILADVLWDDPAEQPGVLAKIVGRIANPARMRITGLLAEVESIVSGLNLRNLAETAKADAKLREIKEQLAAIDGSRAKAGVEHVQSEIKRIRLATVEAL